MRDMLPDTRGHFGLHGGRFVPETLIPALDELEAAYLWSKNDPKFQQRFRYYLTSYAGRPTPLYLASRLSEHCGYKVYLKREDLLHTGAHKINNTLGQALLTVEMGKRRVIAETGAGQHGVATATAAALFGLECVIYMGAEDMRRQRLNVFRMEQLGAEVRKVTSGSQTLKDAINEGLRDWTASVRTTHYVMGTVTGPHPFPAMVRDFQSVIGKEAKEQILAAEQRLPDVLVACVGGGSNAIGLFDAFLDERQVRMIGVEAGGLGVASGKHAARFADPIRGMLHGAMTYVLQDDDGQIQPTHSVSAGLDYPSVGPEHAYLHDVGRVEYVYAEDDEAVAAFQRLSRLEGIIPALESAHAVAYLEKLKLPAGSVVIVNLSGRGDKDVETVIAYQSSVARK